MSACVGGIASFTFWSTYHLLGGGAANRKFAKATQACKKQRWFSRKTLRESTLNEEY